MYLIVGNPADAFCQSLQQRLLAAGQQCQITNSMFCRPAFAALRLRADGGESFFWSENSAHLVGSAIKGVYIQETKHPDPTCWDSDDYEYVCQEVTSAFLGWLQALACPVLNRYTPHTWYARYSRLLAWRRTAVQAGLEISECFDHFDLSGFGFQPTHCPSALRKYRAAVVGAEVIWDLLPPPDYEHIRGPLLRFMELTGLDILELVVNLEQSRSRLFSVALELAPQRFSHAARQRILGQIVRLLRSGYAKSAEPE